VLVALLIVPVAVRRRFLRLWQWLLALPDADKAPVVLVTMLTTQEVGSGVVWAKASDSVLLDRHPGSACGVCAGSHGLERHEQWHGSVLPEQMWGVCQHYQQMVILYCIGTRAVPVG